MRVRIHAWEAASRANGPGLRAVVWFQGCTIGCPGCFNPETHDGLGGRDADTEELVRLMVAGGNRVEGISISGGEPFQQPEALLDLARQARAAGLSVLVFSGYTIEKLQQLPGMAEILKEIDVLVAGPYDRSRHLGRALLGSSNQRLHLLTGRYRIAHFERIPAGEAIVRRDGTVTLSGIAPLRMG